MPLNFSPFNFESAHLKVQRAKVHRLELEQIINHFSDANPYSTRLKNDKNTGEKVVEITEVHTFPHDEFRLILGDCVNNLKCGLDHAVFQASVAVGIVSGLSRVKFPCGNSRKNFESQCKNIFGDVCWFEERMLGLEVFPGGMGRNLNLLTQLNNADKHKFILTVAQAHGHPSIEILFANGHRSVSEGNLFIGGPVSKEIARAPADATINVGDDRSLAPKIFLRNIWNADAIVIMRALEREVVEVIHFLEYLLEAWGHINLPSDYIAREFPKR